ncbi:MAG: roadblock/LC7 domain-containing protein [Neisseriaceae bacterium]|nr:roadblock/LC7 domain-containing protein [Neisseriaceae bacterium]
MSNNKEAVKKHAAVVAQRAMFQKCVDVLTQNVEGILYTIIATDDGFPVAYTNMDEKTATGKAALAASLSGLGDTIAMESSLQQSNAIHIECGNGFIFSRGINLSGKNIVLLVSSTNDLTLATLLWHIKKMVDVIVTNFQAA